MKNILVDTDVLLDFFFDRQPFSESAAKVLSLCEDKKLNGFTTAVIIANTYYLLRKAAPHAQVVDKLKSLLNIIQVIEITHDDVVSALNSDFKDFEDALQNFSAASFGDIDAILTRNIKDFADSALIVLSPKEYLTRL